MTHSKQFLFLFLSIFTLNLSIFCPSTTELSSSIALAQDNNPQQHGDSILPTNVSQWAVTSIGGFIGSAIPWICGYGPMYSVATFVIGGICGAYKAQSKPIPPALYFATAALMPGISIPSGLLELELSQR